MDIQASHPNTLHTNLSLGGGDSATSQHKNMYDTNDMNQQHNTQIHQQQQQPLQLPNHDQQRLHGQQTEGQSTEITSHESSTIPIRNIKVDPETLPQPGLEQEIDNSRIQHSENLLVPDIDLGTVISGAHHGPTEDGADLNHFNTGQKDATPNLNLKNESIGDFNAFHEQIQTVDPVLLWSMVRSRVVPQVGCNVIKRLRFATDKNRCSEPNEKQVTIHILIF